jgi:hypothetical protein
MRRLFCVTSTAIVLGLTLTLPARAKDPAISQPSGTWIWSTYTPAGAALPALVTFHEDGTVAGSNFFMFGGTASNMPRRTTPFHGVWERTGPQTVGVTSLYLVYDALAGRLIGFGRARSTLEFTPGDFDHFDGTMFVDFLSCPTPATCPDPQDRAAVWKPYDSMVPSFVVSAKRLQRVEAGPLQ